LLSIKADAGCVTIVANKDRLVPSCIDRRSSEHHKSIYLEAMISHGWAFTFKIRVQINSEEQINI
jgi:hypothetical protein